MRALLVLAATATLACSVACSQDTRALSEPQAHVDQPVATSPAPGSRSGPQSVEVEMSNVDFHVTPDVTLQVKHLRGRFVPAARSEFPNVDDARSYSITVDTGEVLVDMASLNALMKTALREGDANIEKVQITADDRHQLRQKGLLDKGVKLPFDVKGEVEPTADGRIRMHATSVKGLGVPIKSLMKFFGFDMGDIVKIKPGHGLAVENDDLILNPEQLLPAPRMRGKITAVRVTDAGLVQTFGSGEGQHLSPPPTSRNYIYWRGGRLQFGKLTMTDTDLELIDQDPKDPFDFSVEHWNDQLVAGYSKNTPARGLKTYVPDYADLKH
jgi:hypothetical protein